MVSQALFKSLSQKVGKFLSLSAVISLTYSSILFAGTILLDFAGQPGFNKVTIKWTTQNEINLKGFEIERSFDQKNESFKKIDFVKPSEENKDKKEYTYEDTSVFKSSVRTFYYRLKVVDNNGTYTFSKVISVKPTISSARQTWGSIKAMFR